MTTYTDCLTFEWAHQAQKDRTTQLVWVGVKLAAGARVQRCESLLLGSLLLPCASNVNEVALCDAHIRWICFGRVCERKILQRKEKKRMRIHRQQHFGLGLVEYLLEAEQWCSASAGCRPSADPYMHIAPLWCCTNYSNRMQMLCTVHAKTSRTEQNKMNKITFGDIWVQIAIEDRAQARVFSFGRARPTHKHQTVPSSVCVDWLQWCGRLQRTILR